MTGYPVTSIELVGTRWTSLRVSSAGCFSGMRRFTFLFVTLAVATTLAAAEAVPPNVVIIYADDLGYGDVAAYGHPFIETPNIDRLADEGLRLMSYYAPSPKCSPSRAGLLTGRTPARTGILDWIEVGTDLQLSGDEVTLAELFSTHGYQNFITGKWHLNGGVGNVEHLQPDDHGFDRWLALHGWPMPNQRNPTNFYRDGVALGEVEGFTAQIAVDQAIAWLQERDPSAPFFLYLAMIEPHSLIASPDEFNAHYAEFTRGEPELFENPPSKADPAPTNLEARGPGEYWANVAWMDHEIGRLLDWLDAAGLTDDTLVIFSSDNGPVTDDWRVWWEINMYGDAGGFRGRKGDLYEGGIRVPAIVRWPGRVEAGSVSDAPVYGLDWLPTLASLVGFEVPTDRTIDGEDVSALLLGEPFARSKPLYFEFPGFNGFNYALRRGDWKVLADEALERVSLYNLARDRFELQDQAGKEPDRAAALLAELRAVRDDVVADPLRPKP